MAMKNCGCEFPLSFSEGETFNTQFSEGGRFTTNFGEVQTIYAGVLSDTTEGWNSQKELIAQKNVLYVYTDYQTDTDEEGNTVEIPGIKIGDGKAYLIDIPFTDQLSMEHIRNGTIHVTPQEKEFWNNKVRTYLSEVHDETIVFTTD